MQYNLHNNEKNILISFSYFNLELQNESKKDTLADAKAQLEKDIEMYVNLWDVFLYNRDTSVINSKNFTEDCIIVTAQW